MKKFLQVFVAGFLFFGTMQSCNSKREVDDDEQMETEKDDAREEFKEAEDFEFNMIKNPATGTIPENIHALELEQANSIYAKNSSAARVAENSYFFQGPDNLGGRTRTIVFDVRYNSTSNTTIFSGGVSGGVWKSIDNGTTWVRKSPLNEHYSCTSIVQDPRVGFQDTWYYATGEALGNSAGGTGASYSGNGIYKSVDNGETWARLPNSNIGSLTVFDRAEDYITRLVVSPVDGYLYAAALAGIKRSVDGGTTWTSVLSGTLANSGQLTDLAITSTGRLYAGFGGTNTNTVDGVWTSTTGNTGEWTRIAGTGVATNPTGWNAVNTYGRLVLAVAPGSENLVYIMYYNNITSRCTATATPEAEFYRFNQTDGTFADLSPNLPDEAGCSDGNDPFAVQGGYDMAIAISPTNPNLVLIGGTNVYRSTNGFTSTAATTRIGGYANTSGYAIYANSHSDIHAFAFNPTAPNVLLCGNDGGIQRTNDVTTATVVWNNISTGFRTYQYYFVAIDPRAGNTKVIGGAQDNGTTRNISGTGVNFENVLSGDGVSVGLSDVIGLNTFEYGGSQNGSITRRNSTLASGFGTNIRPSSSVGSNGLFVTLFHLDNDNTEKLYYINNDTIYRTASASTVTTTTWTKLTGVATTLPDTITALATTRGAYTAASNLFFGTNRSKLWRLADPSNVDPTTAPTDISGANFPVGAYISSIAVNPRNDDTVLVTFSNYGVASVFWTDNAKSATPTWINVESTLNLPSYRSSAIVAFDDGVQYFVGTSVGLYKATITAATATTTTWVQEGANNMGNAIVRDLKLRVVDNTLLVGTHGYGMWKASLESSVLPVTLSTFLGNAEKSFNTLTWTVQSEINSKGYQLERKYKGQVEFVPVGYVASKGNGTSASSVYSYKDISTDLSVDQTFYRLRQDDKDGNSKYSPTVIINRKPSAKLVEYISASRNELLIRINNTTNEKLTLRISDMNGRQMVSQVVTASTQHIPITNLPSGSYITEIFVGSNRAYIQRFVK